MAVERFKISARLMTHLGEALISDELVALMELVKNSYDADANFSKVVIDSNYNDGDGLIVVEDDGSGMDYDVVVNSFLVLATDFKIKTQKISKKYGRLALGNKGIGRLSLQRLGDKCTVITKAEDHHSLSFSINWNDYCDPTKDIYDVAIEIKEDKELDEYFKKGHGTKIIISSIKNTSLWESKQTFARFRNEILSIINPYSNEEEKFIISIELNGEKLFSDRYDIKLIRQYSDVDSSFKYISSENKLIIDIKRKRKYLDYLIKNFIKDSYFDGKEVIKTVNGDELYEKVKNYHVEFNLDEVHRLFPFITEKNYRFNNLFLPGDFEGEIFAFDKDGSRFIKEEKDYLNIVNGVKLFRNNFRILPYGDLTNDWLLFTKYSQLLKYNIYKNHSVAGYVYINGEENLEKIREMTNRQGIILDEYGETFLTICRAVVSRILVSQDCYLRNDIFPSRKIITNMGYGETRSFFHGLITVTKKEDHIENTRLSTEMIRKAIEQSGIKQSSLHSYSSISASLDKIDSELDGMSSQIKNERRAIELQQESLDEFKITIGSALISEFMAHEISRTINHSLDALNRIKEHIYNKDFDSSSTIGLFDVVATHLNYLLRYASVIDINSYTKRRKKEIVNLKDYLVEIRDSMPFLSDKDGDIKCFISGDDCSCEIIKTNLTIAIENILINSKYWLDRYKIENKAIMMDVNAESRTIIIYDNGLGINKDIEDKVFDAFVSAKPDDEGRGIGLYITDKLLEETNMKISLSNERNQNGQLFKFVIKF